MANNISSTAITSISNTFNSDNEHHFFHHFHCINTTILNIIFTNHHRYNWIQYYRCYKCTTSTITTITITTSSNISSSTIMITVVKNHRWIFVVSHRSLTCSIIDWISCSKINKQSTKRGMGNLFREAVCMRHSSSSGRPYYDKISR